MLTSLKEILEAVKLLPAAPEAVPNNPTPLPVAPVILKFKIVAVPSPGAVVPP
jgi:hypothetical protein